MRDVSLLLRFTEVAFRAVQQMDAFDDAAVNFSCANVDFISAPL
jgi:hypothetical protein